MRFYDADLQAEHAAMKRRIAELEAINRAFGEWEQLVLVTLEKHSIHVPVVKGRPLPEEHMKDALQQALKNTEDVRRKLAESESGPNCKYCGRDLVYCNCGATGPCASLQAENARLRKALEDAPHAPACRSHQECSIPEHVHPCTCWKARIPEAK